jgi:hypothetical protein
MAIKLNVVTTNQAGVAGETYKVRESDFLANTDRNDENRREDDSAEYLAEMVKVYGNWGVANLVAKQLPVKTNAQHKGYRTRKNNPLNKVDAAKEMETAKLNFQGGAESAEQKLVKIFTGLTTEQKAAFLKDNS